MNKVILMGRLVRDPECRQAQGAQSMSVARYTLAVDRRGKKDAEQTADFLPCVAFGKSAEFAEKYLRKGTKVLIEGHLQTGSYTNKDGQKVYTTDVIIEQQEFAESKAAAGAAGKPETPKASADGFMAIPDGVIDEDLPFNF